MSSRVGPASCLILQEAAKGTCGAGPFFVGHHCQSPRAKHWERLGPLTGALPQQHVIEVPVGCLVLHGQGWKQKQAMPFEASQDCPHAVPRTDP